MKYQVLHVGCGPRGSTLPDIFGEDWQEIRLDIDPNVDPDVVASMTDMSCVADDSVDALYSSHNLEHLYAHEVPIALAEWRRVLKPGGFLFVRVPDILEIAKVVSEDKLEATLYQSPAGPISPIDVLWGHRSAIAAGNHFMTHKTGFTESTLSAKLQQCGYERISAIRTRYEICCTAIKPGQPPVMELKLGMQKSYANRWQFLLSLWRRC